jgi:hypothetical protein
MASSTEVETWTLLRVVVVIQEKVWLHPPSVWLLWQPLYTSELTMITLSLLLINTVGVLYH